MSWLVQALRSTVQLPNAALRTIRMTSYRRSSRMIAMAFLATQRISSERRALRHMQLLSLLLSATFSPHYWPNFKIFLDITWPQRRRSIVRLNIMAIVFPSCLRSTVRATIVSRSCSRNRSHKLAICTIDTLASVPSLSLFGASLPRPARMKTLICRCGGTPSGRV